MNDSAIQEQRRCRWVATLFTLEGHPSDRCVANFSRALQKTIPECTLDSRVLDPKSEGGIAEVSITTTKPVDLEKKLRHDSNIIEFEQLNHTQVVFQADGVFRRHKRLAVFDMDSTLIQQEVIDEIARKIGVEDRVAAITSRAMNGELDFTVSLRERCSLLRGVPASVFDELKNVITLTPGASELVRALKMLGYKTAILSGGFTSLTSWLAAELGMDYAFANHLTVGDDGKTLTGEVFGEIVNAEKKRDHVKQIASTEGIPLHQVLVVGDGANDLPMMWVAGLGVAFNAKPRVQQQAPTRLSSPSMLVLLHLLGLTAADIAELLNAMGEKSG